MTKPAKPQRRTTPPPSLQAYLAGPPRVGQRALAEAVGCNQSMISMLVRGKRTPSAGLAVLLHRVTGVSLKALLVAPTVSRTKPRRPPGRASPVGVRAQATP